MSKDKLKPCPRCGRPAECDGDWDDSWTYCTGDCWFANDGGRMPRAVWQSLPRLPLNRAERSDVEFGRVCSDIRAGVPFPVNAALLSGLRVAAEAILCWRLWRRR